MTSDFSNLRYKAGSSATGPSAAATCGVSSLGQSWLGELTWAIPYSMMPAASAQLGTPERRSAPSVHRGLGSGMAGFGRLRLECGLSRVDRAGWQRAWSSPCQKNRSCGAPSAVSNRINPQSEFSRHPDSHLPRVQFNAVEYSCHPVATLTQPLRVRRTKRPAVVNYAHHRTRSFFRTETTSL